MDSSSFSILDGTSRLPRPALVINLFGGPGIGKTTMAARVFLRLKMRGIEAANPEEHAKIAILKGQPHLLDEQLVILGQTWETLHTLSDKVEAIVVDSPILLCSVYAQGRESSHFHATVEDFHRRMPRINLLLARPAGMVYSRTGRRETPQEALLMDGRIRDALDKAGESYTTLPTTESCVDASIAMLAETAHIWLAEQNRGPGSRLA